LRWLPIAAIGSRISGDGIKRHAHSLDNAGRHFEQRLDSCTTRRTVESAAHLADHVIPRLPVRQWVLSAPKRPLYHLQHDPAALNAALRLLSSDICA